MRLPTPRPTLSRARNAWRALVALACAVPGALVPGCGVAPSQAAETARAWAQGPARWLLQPREHSMLESVRTNADFAHFLASFWQCRDDDVRTPDNPVARAFAERVQAADRLYGERRLRGSLSDRGRALVLLGSPRFLRYTDKRAPALEGTTASGARATRLLRVEIWGYLPADLSPALRQQLQVAPDDQKELVVTFLIGDRRSRLLDGGDLLDLAARALDHCGGS